MIDRYEIGERQTSACGIPTVWLEAHGPDGLAPPDLRRAGGHHARTAPRAGRCPGPSPPSTTASCARCCSSSPTASSRPPRSTAARGHTVHTDRGDLTRAADRGRAGLAAGAGRRRRLPAARRAAVARARGAPGRRRRRPGDLDRPRDRARGLRLELPRARRAADRRRLVRPALPREGQHREAGRGPGLGRRALPGQLDPPQDPPGHRGRHLLRRRLRRATACRSPPRASAPPSTSGWPAGASCAPWWPASARRDEALRRYGAFSDSHEWKFRWMLRAQRIVPRVWPRAAEPGGARR